MFTLPKQKKNKSTIKEKTQCHSLKMETKRIEQDTLMSKLNNV